MRVVIAVVAFWLVSSAAWAKVGDYKFRRLDITSGLSNNQVRSIFVDSKGFAWFGTVSGLNRFDGHNFTVFKHNPADSLSLPFNTIYRICEDYNGNLWVFNAEGELGIYDPQTETFGIQHEVFETEMPVPRVYISAMLIDADGCMWIGNNQHGIFKYCPSTKSISKLVHQQNNNKSIQCDNIVDLEIGVDGNIVAVNRYGVVETIDRKTLAVIKRVDLNIESKGEVLQTYDLFIDKEGDYWVYSQNDASGLYYYSPKSGQQKWLSANDGPLKLTSNIIAGLQQDMLGMIWVGTDHGGINIIDKKTMSVSVVEHQQGVSNSLGQNSVTSLFADKKGIMWVGTFKSGLSFYHPGLFQFNHACHNPFITGSLPSNDIDCFAEDAFGNLWLGTNGDGLIYYNRSANTYKVYKHNPSDANSLSSDVIVYMCVDSKNRLWIGTYYGGLNMFDGKTFKRYVHNPDDPRSITDNRIWSVFEDSQSRIWIGTLGGGLDLFDERENRFTHYKSGDANSIHSDFVLSLAEDKTGNLWVASSNGLDVLDHRTGRIMHYSQATAESPGLSNGVCMSVVIDKRGWTWVGTRNGLNVIDPKNNIYKVITTKDGLSDDNVVSVVEDNNGNIWMGTLNGICFLEVLEQTNLADLKYRLRTFDTMDGVQGKEFNEHSVFKTRKGELLFGGANGYNIFYPNDIGYVDFNTKVGLTALKLQNKNVAIGEEIGGKVILPRSIGSLDELVLKHNQNVFAIEFSALNYVNPEKMKYRYILEGFNDEWIATDANNRLATYTNLNPGTYRFRVMATDVNGKWSGEATELRITVVPPFYASGWAMFIYGIVLVTLVLLLIRTIVRREHLKFQRKQERLEHERMHELDNMKIKFFTNISHEFRTPLTLILTPLDKLIANAVDNSSRQQLVLVQRNGKRLLNLVNQLLDFRKMEVQKIAVNLSFDNVIKFLKDTTSSFSDLSESKNINLRFLSGADAVNTWFDPDKIEKVMFNLLNNAFKFTPANGDITVSVAKIDNQPEKFEGKPFLLVKVSDTGIGIAKDKQEQIFERFFQANSSGQLMNQGSGIGLALTLEFVKLHLGTIEVESEPNKGTTFTVMLPFLTEEEVAQIDHSADAGLKNNVPTLNEADDTDVSEPLVEHSGKPIVLIVEDNEDLRFYLKENLKQTYQIEEAVNGNDALQRIGQVHPTLIVTDVMMPEMDGLELCKRLKNDSKTSHIPVVMLTARNTNEQKLEGLEIGADEYITKPFNYELLELKIKKLIEQRQNLQKSLHVHYEIKPGEIGVTSLDEKFLQKALALVEKNISNVDYSVERLSKELGVSRGHLYNKIVALTGKTPIEFIRIMRLKRAAQLLGKSQLSVSEIAFEVGFNDPKYFSKYFKDEFHISPSDYAKAAIKGTLENL